MVYKIAFKPVVKKDFRKLSTQDATRVRKAIDALATNPKGKGCSRLKAKEKLWRKRVGSIRIVYEIIEQTLIVTIINVAHRKDVYRKIK